MKRKLVLLFALVAVAGIVALIAARRRPEERSSRRDAPALEERRIEHAAAPEPAVPTGEPPVPEPSAPAPAPVPPAAQEAREAVHAGLRVLVHDQEGPPVQGARVRLVLSIGGVGRSGPEATTDANGIVVFGDLVAEQVIAASAVHAGFTRSHRIRLTAGRVTELSIAIPRNGLVVRGVLRHAETGPVSGATVQLSRSRPDGFDYVSGQTDADGRFELARATAGDWKLEIYGPGLAYHEKNRGTWRLEPPGPCEREIVIGRLSLTGVVRDASTGAPLVDAEVQPQEPLFATTKTDRDGRFALRSLPPGKYSVLVRKPGYANHWFRDVVIRAYEPAQVVFELDPAATLRILIVDEKGAALPGEHIVSFDREDGQGWSGNRVADADGVIHLQSIAPGPCKVSAYGWAGRAEPVPIEVAGGTNDVRLVMKAPEGGANRGSLTGVVREARTLRPLAGVRIRLRTGNTRDAYTDASGRFALDRVFKGTWTVRAGRDGYLDRDLGSVEIAPGRTATIQAELQPARTLHVRVLDKNGLPYVGELYLFCWPEEREERYSWRLRTDADGRLTCHRIPAGKSRIRVFVPERGKAEAPQTLTTPEATLELQLQ